MRKMPVQKYTNKALAAKIDCEGGYWEAIAYGIRSADIKDKSVAALWQKLEDAYLASKELDKKLEKHGLHSHFQEV